MLISDSRRYRLIFKAEIGRENIECGQLYKKPAARGDKTKVAHLFFMAAVAPEKKKTENIFAVLR